MYWEYIVYSQYIGGLKWKLWIPAENDDIIYEQPLYGEHPPYPVNT